MFKYRPLQRVTPRVFSYPRRLTSSRLEIDFSDLAKLIHDYHHLDANDPLGRVIPFQLMGGPTLVLF